MAHLEHTEREAIAMSQNLAHSGRVDLLNYELYINQECYVPHAVNIYQLARIVEIKHHQEEDEEVFVELLEPEAKNERISFSRNQVFIKTDMGHEGVGDMVTMEHLHEPALVENLEIRFRARKIYTYVGSILISVNPYKNIPIYTNAIIRMYDGQPVGVLPPHIFALADTAYQSARTEHKNQSILISGESGAGKTEAVKLILKYLTFVSGKDKIVAKVKITPQERVLSTNPILEAFGNAKTIRNNNSSRFAKMIDIQLDNTGYIVGGRIQGFLLEKSRVVRQANNERNFHVFFYLLAGCDKTERAVWGLYDAKHYRYTNQTKVYEIKGVDSKLEYVALKRAMTIGGINVNEQHLTFTTLSAVLHLGNVRFVSEDDEARVKNQEVVKWVAHLLKCEAKLLTDALLTREAHVGDETVSVPISQQQAQDTRDTLAKQLYGRTFGWIVSRLNQDMEADESQTDTLISLLDIFGFEEYETNAFEQFCINYANERMQFEFNEHIFKQERASYLAEGIDVADFKYADNTPALNLIENDPGGLLLVLDEETRSSTGTDQSFLVKVLSNPHYQPTTQHWDKEAPVFVISHYAGEVVYDVTGFTETNREAFSEGLLIAIKSSRIPHLVSLFDDLDSHGLAKNKLSLSAQFRNQLIGLMELLGAVSPQYVRCIKPNGKQSGDLYDRFEMLRQLRHAGVLQTIRIRKDGYPFQRPHDNVMARYQELAPPGLDLVSMDSLQSQIRALMAALQIGTKKYQIGHTKVFFKDDVYHQLEGMRANYYNSAATRIQASMRGHMMRQHYKRKMVAIKLLQHWVRIYLQAVDVTEEVGSALAHIQQGQGDMAQSLAALNHMAARGANVEKIVDQGGINTLLSVLDNDNDDMLAAGTKALSTMAKHSHASQQIARSGALTQMVRNIELGKEQAKGDDDKNANQHSINLLGDLSTEEKNVGLVIREGGMAALTGAMAKQQGKTNMSDINASAAVKALGNLSKSQRVAKMMGRDQATIKAVLDGMEGKPKFARLTEYSVNILANLSGSRENVDAVVDLGGIEKLVLAMQHHYRNEKILSEIARTFRAIARNPMYAKMIGERGGMKWALKSLVEDPEHCGASALAIIEALYTHPANTKRLLKGRGIETFLNILSSDVQNEALLTTLVSILSVLVQDSAIADMVIGLEGPRIVLESISNHPLFVNHNQYSIDFCLKLAQHDRETMLTLKQSDVVSLVAHSMERHASHKELVESARHALHFLADRRDLESAMDIVARSRMKEQTEQILLTTGDAIIIVGGLATMPDNVEYIITEGGIPIFLSVVNGTSLNVKAHIADKVLVPSIRALARLLINENNIDEFIAEGGVQSLVASISGQSEKIRVCEVCVLASSRLIASGLGYAEMAKLGGIDALLEILTMHPEFEHVVVDILLLLTKIAQSKANGVRILHKKHAMEAILIILETYQTNAPLIMACTELLRILATSKQVERSLLHKCGELVLSAMRDNGDEVTFAMSGLRFLLKFTKHNESKAFLQEKRAAVVVLTVLDWHYGNVEVTSLATKILGFITGKRELEQALRELQERSDVLKEDGKLVDVIESMLLPITLIGCMSSNTAAATIIVNAKGFQVISNCLRSAEVAKSCIPQERLLKHLASAITRLVNHKDHTDRALLTGTMKHLLQSVSCNVDYEDFVEEAQHALEVLSRNPKAISYMIDIQSAPTVAKFVAGHPLNDNILISATKFVTRLAKGAESKTLSAVRKEGTALALIAVGRFMNQEEHLNDALHSVAELAALVHDNSHIVVGSTNMKLFLKVLKKHKNSPQVMIAACGAFVPLAEDRTFSEMFVSILLLEEIMEALESYSGDEAYCTVALAVLQRIARVIGNIPALNELEVISLVLETMTRHITHHVLLNNATRLFTHMSVDPPTAIQLANSGSIRRVFNAVRAHPLQANLVVSSIEFAHSLALDKENHLRLIAERSKEMIAWTMRAYPKLLPLQKLCRETLELLVTDQDERDKLMGEGKYVGQLAEHEMPSILALQQQDREDMLKTLIGYMSTIKDTSAVPKDVGSSLTGLATSEAPMDVLEEMIRRGGLARLVALLDFKNHHLEILLPVFKCLIKFADKGEHVNVIVAYGGIGALLRALQKHIDKSEVLSPGITLLGKLSVFNRLKVLIGLQGGVPILNKVMEQYLDAAPLLNKCCYTMGNLAANCLPNRGAITRGGGVNLISFAMQKHRTFLDLVINASRALSPLCADNEQARVDVCKGGGSLVIVRSILAHPQNPGLLQNGLNCLHKISKQADVLSTLIHQGSIQAVVASMKAYPKNQELQQFAMEILSNLSVNNGKDMAPNLTKGGTTSAVVKAAMMHSKSPRIQLAAFTTLSNIASASPQESELVCELGFVPKLLATIGHKKVSEDVVKAGTDLLTILASQESNGSTLVEAQTGKVLVTVMRRFHKIREVVRKSLLTLFKLSTTKSHALQLAQEGVVRAVVDALLERAKDDKFLTDVLRVFVNLAIVEENALVIAQDAVEPLVQCVDHHMKSHNFLRMFYMLLGNLSMWMSPSRHLIEHGMVPVIITCIKRTDDYPALIVTMIKVLTNFCGVGESAKRVLIQDGALETVNVMMIKYRTHIQLAKEAENFLYKLSGAHKRRGSVTMHDETMELSHFVAKKVKENTRNLVTGGSLFKQYYDDKTVKNRILRVSVDFTTLEWVDPKNQSMQDPDNGFLPLKYLAEIRPGACTPALLRKPRADPLRSMALFDMRRRGWTLNLEAQTESEAHEWMEALQQLKDATTSHSVGLH